MNIQSISYTPTYIWKQEVSGNVIFRVLASHKAAPEGMSQKQLEKAVYDLGETSIQTFVQKFGFVTLLI
jgi:hypothetical protein